MNPIFTIVIPIFNKKPHLERSINSVLNQDFKNYELLLIDDSSSDGSLKIAEEFENQYSNISLFKRDTPGPGGYAARNLGIREAKGEWVAFLDADDQWFPELLSTYISLIEKYPECFFYSTAQKRVSSNGKITLDPYSENNDCHSEIKFDLLSYSIAGGKGQNPIQTSSVLAKRSLLLELEGFPEGRCIRGGDRDTWLRLLTKTDMVWTPYLGATYYRDSINMVTKNLAPQISSCLDATYKSIMQNKDFKLRWGSQLTKAIKKQSNFEKKTAFKKRIIDGSLKTRDIKYLYFFSDPKFCIMIFLLSLITGQIRVFLIKYLKKIK